MKQKVAMAMSGGVDSSVAALLLKDKGYDITGFFIKFWSDPHCPMKKENSCCNEGSMRSAQNVAFQLGIPFYAIDARKAFKKAVVDNFIDVFAQYRTPNPCVKCNKLIKFGWFLEFAQSMGFEKVATGHYCQISKNKKGVYQLLKGNDSTKDQSYFLYRLNQKQLSKVMFPVGKYNKKEVWKIANQKKIKIRTAKESQEICFVGDPDYRDFLKRYMAPKYFRRGNIVKTNGKILGCHTGLLNYTVGQRKGIEVKGIKDESRKPLYVIGFNVKSNELIVGEDELVYGKEMTVTDLSWTSVWAEEQAFKIPGLMVGIRYHHPVVPCKLEKKIKGKLTVQFKNPQRAITPGQSAVFYKGNTVLGGGEISLD